MKTIKLFIFLAFITALTSCYKDRGNYDYIVLDDVQIDTSNAGIKPSYAIYRYDTLRIEPKVYLNNTLIRTAAEAEGKLSFTWSIYQANVGGGIHSRDTLSTEINLEKPITKVSGGWIVLLTVKNIDTNIETYQKFNVQVDEILSDGWMVLYEKEGDTDVGLIVDDRIKTGTLKQRIFTDLIKNTNGEPLKGKPISLLQSASPLISREVVVASEKDMQAFVFTTFEKYFSFENFFYGAPGSRSLKAFTANNARKEMVVNDNKVHISNFSSGTTRTILFGASLAGNYGELEEWSPKYYAQAYDAVVYDKTNKKFMYSIANSVKLTDLPAQTSTTVEWNPSNVGLDLKAYDYGRNNCEYMIMNNGTSYYLLTANFMSATANTIALKKYDMSSAPGISNVSAMASSTTGSYILYGSERNVYSYSYDSSNPITLAWSAPSGENITSIRFLRFYFSTVQTVKLATVANQYVYIATYNESTGEGKVYNVKIDQTNGSIDQSSQRVYEGFGKIKDMNYKWVL